MDSKEFEELYREEGPRVEACADRALHSKEDSEDAAQNAFLQMLIATAAVLRPRAFLFKSAWLRALDELRYRKKWRGPSDAADPGDAQGDPADLADDAVSTLVATDPTPDQICEQQQKFEYIERALNELPPRCRQAFIRVVIDGADCAEVAKELHTSDRTVYRLVDRAKEHAVKAADDYDAGGVKP